MPEESVETTPSAEQPNKRLVNLLGATALTLAILMIGLVLAALGFLLYGLLTAQLGASIIGVGICVISFGLLFVVFRLVLKLLRRETHGRAGDFAVALATGRDTYAKVKEEKSKRYPSAKGS